MSVPVSALSGATEMRAPAFGGVAAQRMFMARCELSFSPTVRVYEVEPTSLQIPEYKRGFTAKKWLKNKVVPREQTAWFGSAERKLCAPGFAAFGGSRLLALESLLRAIREYRNTQHMLGMNEAIREVNAAIRREQDACRATV